MCYITEVSCGAPPAIPYARYTLLNSSAVNNGIAVYTCEDGYRLSNGKWGPLQWAAEPVTISCLFPYTSRSYLYIFINLFTFNPV